MRFPLTSRARHLGRVRALTAATLLLLSAALIGAARPCLAWYNTGHEVVALLAYQDMKPETRAKVDVILRSHPDYSKWLAELPAGTKPEDQGRYIFAIASTWPDRVKNPTDATVTIKLFDPADKRHPAPDPFPTDPHYPDRNMHKDWHYVDLPVNADGKARPAPTEDNLLMELPVCRTRLGQAGVPESWRAYYLSWVEHLVGDAHQPLHCTSRYSEKFPAGDQGGNLVKLDGPAKSSPHNLHAYWDGLLGDTTDWKVIEKTTADIQAQEPSLLAGFDPAIRDSADPTAWCQESLALDENTVYAVGASGPDADVPLPEPDAAYHERALAVAHQRAALAGHRLAKLLDDALAAATP